MTACTDPSDSLGARAMVGSLMRDLRTFALSGLLYVLTVQAATGQVVRGSVTEEGSNAPIPAASVILLDEEEVIRARVLTDDRGGYFIHSPETGGFWIRVEKVGFQTLESRPFVMAREDSLVLNFATVPQVALLEGVTVNSSTPQTRNYAAFLERQRFGYARVITPERLERLPITQLPVRIVGMVPGGRYDATSDRIIVQSRGRRCSPSVVLDNEPSGESRLSLIVPPHLIRAIEFYRDP